MQAKHRPPPQNLLDKAIAVFAPRVAARRLQARQFLALSGGYTGARRDRAATSAWNAKAGSPDTDVIVDLPDLRARSRDLERNAPVAGAIIGTTVTHVVGTGLSCNPQIDFAFLGITEEAAAEWQADTRRRYKAWSESTDVDLARVQNIYGLQSLALATVLVSGDAFVNTPRIDRAGRQFSERSIGRRENGERSRTFQSINKPC